VVTKIAGFEALLVIISKLEVKEAVVKAGIISFVIILLASLNSTLVHHSAELLKALCEVAEYREKAMEEGVLVSLTAGMKNTKDNVGLVAVVQAIGKLYKLT
jgi:hypothetical protein